MVEMGIIEKVTEHIDFCPYILLLRRMSNSAEWEIFAS